MKKQAYALIWLCCFVSTTVVAQKITIDRNKPERKEWFSDRGFGLLIQWSIDGQFGPNTMESLGASSKDYQDTYFNEFPKTFTANEFNAQEWAWRAKLAGVSYVILPARQYDGFCMWDTKSTQFNSLNSGYGKDILREAIEAFRNQGIAIGLYFSPDNYHAMYQQGYPLSRESQESSSAMNTALWEINKKQLGELLSNYGKIDLLFIDERSDWANMLVANFAWTLQPDLLVTGGGMECFENFIPQKVVQTPWLTCFTMESSPKWDASSELREPSEIVNLLAETRARGGNFMLSVSPGVTGIIAEPEQEILREIGLWYSSNKPAIEGVRPWHIPGDNYIWFTSTPDKKTVFAIVDDDGWEWQEERSFLFRSIRGNKETQVSVSGQSDTMMEYQVYRSPKAIHSSLEEGLFVNVTKARNYGKNRQFPVVIRLDNVEFNEKYPAKK